MKKNFFAAALILSLGVGSFAACSSDDINGQQTEQKKTTTMMSVALKMPATSGTRAATDQPYNYIGEWLGQEKIKNVKVYIFNQATGNREVNPVLFSAATNDFSASLVGSDFVIRPNKGIEVSQGAKTVYVVVNSNENTDALLDAHTTLTAFEPAYKGDQLAFNAVTSPARNHTGVATAASTVEEKNGVASEMATLDKTGGLNPSDWKNVIVMTGEAATGPIDDNVSETTAISGVKNQVSVTVKRLVARAAVTSVADFFTLNEDDPYNHGHNTDIGTVSGFTYVAAQGERKVNFLQGSDAANTSDDGAGHAFKWNSPAIDFLSDAHYAEAGPAGNAADARAKYDYAPLWKGDAATNGLLGTKVATKGALALAAGNPNAAVIGQLMEGDFLFPTTHKWGNTAANSGYKKGNTAYLLIRTIFQPKKINIDNDPAGANTGAVRPTSPKPAVEYTYNAITATTPAAAPATGGALPNQLVRGANGMFYSTVWASQDPMYNGVNGQAIEIFQKVERGGAVVGYKMLYFAWVNPDNTTGLNAGKWLNSPVYRNNIYHVELDGVGGTGLSWNPLIPGDNTNPNTTTPNNPDSQTPPTSVTIPGNPPVTPPNIPTPVTPQNPLTPDKTFMSVKTTVLPWQVHGYKFKLQNQ